MKKVFNLGPAFEHTGSYCLQNYKLFGSIQFMFAYGIRVLLLCSVSLVHRVECHFVYWQ